MKAHKSPLNIIIRTMYIFPLLPVYGFNGSFVYEFVGNPQLQIGIWFRNNMLIKCKKKQEGKSNSQDNLRQRAPIGKGGHQDRIKHTISLRYHAKWFAPKMYYLECQMPALNWRLKNSNRENKKIKKEMPNALQNSKTEFVEIIVICYSSIVVAPWDTEKYNVSFVTCLE